ncbi:MAG: group III truncated hemoglobin, partial [Ilyomonas sp.]
MKDIEERKDLFELLEAFYVKAFADELIGFYFTDVIKLDLETHLPIITDFWESVLLNIKQYRGDVMKLHQHINHLSPFKEEHFNRWVQIFCEMV